MFDGMQGKNAGRYLYCRTASVGKPESYSATLTYRVMDDEGREYRFNQWVSMPHSFKIILITPDNLAGKIIVSNGKEILIEHSKVEDSIKFNVKSLSNRGPYS